MREAAQPLLRVEDVGVRFGGIVALDGVSFAVMPAAARGVGLAVASSLRRFAAASPWRSRADSRSHWAAGTKSRPFVSL